MQSTGETTEKKPSYVVLNFSNVILNVALLLGLSAGLAHTTIIPSDRMIDWTQSGIPGGIPNRTTIYSTIQASTYGNGSSDATAGIQAALDACPASQVVLLSAGTFRINGSLTVPSNVTLRGAGSSQTILDAHGSAAGVINFGPDESPSPSSAVSVTSGCNKGSQSITVSDASGIAVGTYLILTALNDSFVTSGACTWCDQFWNGTRCMGQTLEVTSVNGNTIGVTPIYWTYPSSLAPTVMPLTASCKYGGVENLQVYANNTGYTTNERMSGCAYCWVLNCENNYADGDHAEVYWSYRCEIRHNYFHDAFLHTAGSTDADIFLAAKSSGILVVDNILRRMHVGVMINWGASGNVIAYNYCEGNFDTSATNVLMSAYGFHGAHPMFQLFEGNIGSNISADSYWGSSSHATLLRNWFKGATQIQNPLRGRGPLTGSPWEACQGNRAVQIDYTVRYPNVVGNLVGSPEELNVTHYNNGLEILPSVASITAPTPRAYDSTTYGYTWGYGEEADDGSYAGDSSLPQTTSITHGNYTYADNTIAWDPTISDHNIPASMFLSSKPSWFGTLKWPPIDPTYGATISNTSIPAGYRYVYGVDPPESGDSVPAAPSNLRIIPSS
jgi:Pectate lyase superfamily protein